MLFKVLSDFTCLTIDVNNPQGRERRFKRHERIAGEKKDVWADGQKCNFMSDDFLALGVPMSAITVDGNYRVARS